MDGSEPQVIRPQPGPQERFLGTPADIAIYGGAAGGGKTWALLMEPLRHVANGNFGAVFFRRTTVQVRNEGGLWDESMKLYPLLGGTPKEHVLTWDFPAGSTVSFAHLEHDKTVLNWQGSQIALICFDELTHFSASQFWYMVSRNRSMSGVRPYIRATCNPDADSWVAEFIAWWIDQDTGLAIPERAGVMRWFVRVNNTLFWADTAEELQGRFPGVQPKSATFIPAKLADNAALMAADPGYLANLMALPQVERERLLGGNWKVRVVAGSFFKREWFNRYRPGDLPTRLNKYGASDYAVTAAGGDNTVLRVWGIDHNEDIWLLPGGYRAQASSDEWIERQIDLIQKHKPFAWFGEAGVIQKAIEPMLRRRMRTRKAHCRLEWLPSIQDKATRARGFQSRAAMGCVWIPEGPDGDLILDEYENFTGLPGGHDDDVDTGSLIGRALDAAHPAIAPRVSKPLPKDRWDAEDEGSADGWKTR